MSRLFVKRPGRTLCFRADIDALPIAEDTDLAYSSQNPGVMHACGHDFHTAALLGAAELLQNRRRELAGTVKLFFQPDEEGDALTRSRASPPMVRRMPVNFASSGRTFPASPAWGLSVRGIGGCDAIS